MARRLGRTMGRTRRAMQVRCKSCECESPDRTAIGAPYCDALALGCGVVRSARVCVCVCVLRVSSGVCYGSARAADANRARVCVRFLRRRRRRRALELGVRRQRALPCASLVLRLHVAQPPAHSAQRSYMCVR
eukprot:1021882-Prymnesium_polylepis.1